MIRIFILYSHFSPAFKAGGPVQSLVNLVDVLKDEYSFYIVCSAYEMGESTELNGIEPDTWNHYAPNVKVFYARSLGHEKLKFLMEECNPDIVYINGMFLPVFNWLPLYIAKVKNKQVVLAPRGMLQTGALAVKPFKKKVFLSVFKVLRAYKKIVWHATDEQEQVDIRKLFGGDALVHIARNIPKASPASVQPRAKETGTLNLVYLSLITAKKNLHIILEALKKITTPLQFDIYGPIKDEYYWNTCKQLLQSQIHTINYKGTVNPSDVQSTLQKYHAFILPTKGENFGHAIYEALSSGTIPILSPYTPWGNLQEKEAGLTVYSWETEAWASAIHALQTLDQESFDRMSANASGLAKTYFEESDFKSEYRKLFTS